MLAHQAVGPTRASFFFTLAMLCAISFSGVGAQPLDNDSLRALRDDCKNIGWVSLASGDACNRLETADTSEVTDMSSMFLGASSFNSDLSAWNTAKVMHMGSMFQGASSFNSDLSAWNTAKVMQMGWMFKDASAFHSDLSAWDVSKVVDMYRMFNGALSFNSDLSSWNTAQVISMRHMFAGATSFNSDLSAWDVSKVTNMERMFYETSLFNSDLSAWNTAKVMNMNSMFQGTSSFNSNLSAWNTSQVELMFGMFSSASSFNSDLSAWNTAKVMHMGWMFNDASAFHSDLSAWDVSKVVDMYRMFNGALSFNSDLSAWDVSKVTSMERMFYGASLFDSDLSAWNTTQASGMSSMFHGAERTLLLTCGECVFWRLWKPDGTLYRVGQCGQDCVGIDLSNQGIEILPRVALSNLASVQTVLLNDNRVPKLTADPNLFSADPALKTLHLARNSITEIEPGAFRFLCALENLDLSDNPLTVLQAGTFSGCVANSLKQLRLRQTCLRNVEAAGFAELGNVGELDLSGHDLDTITTGTFQGLESLQVLSFASRCPASDGSIPQTRIEPGAFESLHNLQVLDVSNNNITDLPAVIADLLSTNTKIVELRLEDVLEYGRLSACYSTAARDAAERGINVSGCNFTGSEGCTFSVDAEQVLTRSGKCNNRNTHLDLSGLGAVSMASGLFDGMGWVETLLLNDNPLVSLLASESGAIGNATAPLASLTNLTLLDLRRTTLSEVEEDALSGLTMLQTLLLDECEVASLPPRAWLGLDALSFLSLRSCRLSVLHPRSFAGLHALSSLVLDDNTFPSLPSRTFEGLPLLDSLYMSNGILRVVEEGAFSGLHSLRVLRMENNLLSVLGGLTLYPLQRLEHLWVRGNYFTCTFVVPHKVSVLLHDVTHVLPTCTRRNCLRDNIGMDEVTRTAVAVTLPILRTETRQEVDAVHLTHGHYVKADEDEQQRCWCIGGAVECFWINASFPDPPPSQDFVFVNGEKLNISTVDLSLPPPSKPPSSSGWLIEILCFSSPLTFLPSFGPSFGPWDAVHHLYSFQPINNIPLAWHWMNGLQLCGVSQMAWRLRGKVLVAIAGTYSVCYKTQHPPSLSPPLPPLQATSMRVWVDGQLLQRDEGERCGEVYLDPGVHHLWVDGYGFGYTDVADVTYSGPDTLLDESPRLVFVDWVN